jgi:hypothetical protein
MGKRVISVVSGPNAVTYYSIASRLPLNLDTGRTCFCYCTLRCDKIVIVRIVEPILFDFPDPSSSRKFGLNRGRAIRTERRGNRATRDADLKVKAFQRLRRLPDSRRVKCDMAGDIASS